MSCKENKNVNQGKKKEKKSGRKKRPLLMVASLMQKGTVYMPIRHKLQFTTENTSSYNWVQLKMCT